MFQTENPKPCRLHLVSRKTQELKTLIVDKMGMRGTLFTVRECIREMRLRLYSRSLNERYAPLER